MTCLTATTCYYLYNILVYIFDLSLRRSSGFFWFFSSWEWRNEKEIKEGTLLLETPA